MILSSQTMGLFLDHSYELTVPGLRVWTSLGCSAEERTTPQPIDIDIEVKFSKEPRGCTTDDLTDVVCYHTLTEKIIESLRGKSFHLIEHTAKQIFETVAAHMQLPDAILAITITKPNHPVPHVQKGIRFKYCRRIPQKSL